jgi:hypothetical protein
MGAGYRPELNNGGPLPAIALPPYARLGGGMIPAPASGPGAVAPISQSFNIFPWWLYEYPNALDWNAAGLNFVAVANARTVATNFSFQVSPQNQGVIKQVTLVVQNSLANIDLRVTLLINGQPLQGWTGIPFPPVAATGVVVPYNGMVVRMKQNETLTAIFAEASGTNYTCSIYASGWQVSSQDIARLSGGIAY